MAKMIYHLIPTFREKECEHQFIIWTGKIPCTGTRKCSMCGMNEEEIYRSKTIKK
jgi:hypothetical protein